MTTIESLKSEIAAYATDKVKVEIIDFYILPSGGSKLNQNETFRFRVRVTNQGDLNMNDVKIKVAGTNYVGVDDASTGPFTPNNSFVTATSFNLNAGNIYTLGYFYGKALNLTPTPATPDVLVRARINQWDANLDNILKVQTTTGAWEGELKGEVETD